MAAPQSSDPTPSRPGQGPLRALLWPAAAAGLGMLLIYNSFGASEDNKPTTTPAVLAPALPGPDVGEPALPGPDVGAPALPGAPATSAAPSPSVPLQGPAMPRSQPKRIRIPTIAVDAPFTSLAIGPTGQLDAPPPNDKNLVGWFKDGATPGERGSAIVAGHVDTKTGPAVFLQLQFLKPGSTVDITRADGTIAEFKVDSVEKFSKARFPNKRVYADTTTAQLRLITCGGTYDRKAKDYEDNVVVFAHLDGVKSN
ncbi:class F sortase [Streptomyces sp. NPDC058231]|uniref:class F sortase n=1 Tax=unclassified Streptomyces TaxID=2593676 RepID=UPI0036EA88A5